MARHRNFQQYDEDDWADDYDMPFTPDTPLNMPLSPNSAQYVFNRDTGGFANRGNLYLPSPVTKPQVHPKSCNPSSDSDQDGLIFAMETETKKPSKRQMAYEGPPDFSLGDAAHASASTADGGVPALKTTPLTIRRTSSDQRETDRLAETLRMAKMEEKKVQEDVRQRLTNTPSKTPSKTDSRSNVFGAQNSLSPTARFTPSKKPPTLVIPQMSEKRRKKREDLIANCTERKPNLNLVVIGHVDAGKSTLMGHLLYLCGRVDDRIIRMNQKQCKEQGKATFHFAWVLDQHEEERNRGITVDVSVNFFETETKRITLLDAPGHRDFIPNMISGAAQADAAVLVVSANAGEFESGFQDDGQTREHAELVRALGIRHLIVAVNKLDCLDWDQTRFYEIKELITQFLKKHNFKQVIYVPVSGLSGTNLVEKSKPEPQLKKWYLGPSLLELIDNLPAPPREEDKALRMAVTDVFKSGSTWSIAGKVSTGCVVIGDSLLLMPINQPVSVKSINNNSTGEDLTIAKTGENVELALKGIDDASVLAIGHVLCSPERPVPVVCRFRCKMETKDLTMPLMKGSTVEVHNSTTSEPASLGRLFSILDKKGAVKSKWPRCIPQRTLALVEVKLQKPICLERYEDFRQFGRVTLRVSGKTVAVGLVTKLYDN